MTHDKKNTRSTKTNDKRVIIGSRFISLSEEIPEVDTLISWDLVNIVDANAVVANYDEVIEERMEDFGRVTWENNEEVVAKNVKSIFMGNTKSKIILKLALENQKMQ